MTKKIQGIWLALLYAYGMGPEGSWASRTRHEEAAHPGSCMLVSMGVLLPFVPFSGG
jgi:hypothetical protein